MNSGARGGMTIVLDPGSSPRPPIRPLHAMSAAAAEFEAPVLEAPPPDRIGKYQVIRKLGDGATSEVYLCHDPFAGRDVAVKIVYQDRLNDPQGGKVFRKLFVTEASLAGKLSHPHIAQIYDAVVGDKMSYIVMEYVAGGTLEPFCAARRACCRSTRSSRSSSRRRARSISRTSSASPTATSSRPTSCLSAPAGPTSRSPTSARRS